jgi:hypothetical protein
MQQTVWENESKKERMKRNAVALRKANQKLKEHQVRKLLVMQASILP